jgi:cytochrome c oxidase subunit 4
MSEHIVPTRVYFLIFAALVVLTGVTTTVAFFDLGIFNPVVAMSIAVFKASLVVLYFMHMRYSSRMAMIIGGASVFWLGILLVLIMSDYAVRGAGWY